MEMSEVNILDQTALELYRWKVHNLTRKKKPDSWSWGIYWKEMGAFISVLPRQSGKSTMIGKMIRMIGDDDYILIESIHLSRIIVMINGMRTIDPRGICDLNLSGVEINRIHLFCDEFRTDYGFRSLLNNDWKSVTMVGSYNDGE